MTAPALGGELAEQLARVPTSHDGPFRYAPCALQLKSGEIVAHVYVAEESAYLRLWGHDPSRSFIDLSEVVGINESAERLPAPLADELYAAGESGMGYFVFTVRFRDGRAVAFLTGNAVDFPAWPDGISASEAIAVEPHVGRDQLQNGGRVETGAKYAWCLYSSESR